MLALAGANRVGGKQQAEGGRRAQLGEREGVAPTDAPQARVRRQHARLCPQPLWHASRRVAERVAASKKGARRLSAEDRPQLRVAPTDGPSLDKRPPALAARPAVTAAQI